MEPTWKITNREIDNVMIQRNLDWYCHEGLKMAGSKRVYENMVTKSKNREKERTGLGIEAYEEIRGEIEWTLWKNHLEKKRRNQEGQEEQRQEPAGYENMIRLKDQQVDNRYQEQEGETQKTQEGKHEQREMKKNQKTREKWKYN